MNEVISLLVDNFWASGAQRIRAFLLYRDEKCCSSEFLSGAPPSNANSITSPIRPSKASQLHIRQRPHIIPPMRKLTLVLTSILILVRLPDTEKPVRKNPPERGLMRQSTSSGIYPAQEHSRNCFTLGVMLIPSEPVVLNTPLP